MQGNEGKIIDAFLILINQKSLTEITDSEIIYTANVSRSTFYKHFNNKIDILKRFEKDFLNLIVKNYYHKINSMGIQKITPRNLLDIFVEIVIPIIYEERDRLKILQTCDAKEIWLSFVRERAIYLVTTLMPNVNHYQLKLVVSNIIDILTVWLDSEIPMYYQNFQLLFKEICGIQFYDLLNKHTHYNYLRNEPYK